MAEPKLEPGLEADTTHAFLIVRLAEIQKELCALGASLSEKEYRAQFHPDLSPLGWHLGHTLFIENLWLRETLRGDDDATAAVRDLYLPQNTHKPVRGSRLPPRAALLNDCLRMQRDNLALLDNPPLALADHRLMQNDYLLKFLAQHHAMHLETMHMALSEKQLQKKYPGCHSPKKPLEPAAVHLQPVTFDGGEVEVGGNDAWCFDNELPQHRKTLQNFALNATSVTNAEFLGFIASDGYDNAAWWDDKGQQWLQKTGARAPHHWLDDDGAWYGADSRGYYDLEADTPVHGLSHHEARAFACYAGARLPHESEWETAHRQDPMHKYIHPNDHAWEWCTNAFYPYPGFKPFPYDEYSTPWFNGTYYSLRGHSRHTPDVLQRPTFRNFHTADKRHIFAGVRVAIV